MSMNENLRELLSVPSSADFTRAEIRSIRHAANYFGQLEDHVLAEVTRFAVASCAFRLAVDTSTITDVRPTAEVMHQALKDTLKLIEKSVDDDF